MERDDCEEIEPTPIYEIRLKGEITSTWTSWFSDFEISCEQGITLLTGPIPDQAALHGMLMKIQNLGLQILSVNVVHQNNDDKKQ